MSAPAEVLNRLGGEAAPAASGEVFEVRNPADVRDLVAIAPDSGAADVAAAVEGAAAAAPGWAATPPHERSRLLERAADLLAAQADRVAEEMTAEMGKPIRDARNEVIRTAENLLLYAGEALRLQGRTFAAEADTLVATVLDPVGVVGVITPWNFPLSLAGRKIGPALAAGNTVVFKPSSMTPLMGERLADALHQAGLPPGVLQVVHGFDAGALVVADPGVAAVTFTGSTAVGEKIHAAVGLGRRVQLELGGNNPVVVLADADLDKAAAVVSRSSFSLSGQACTAAGRILVDDAVYDDLVERVTHLAEGLVVGPGTEPGVDMGPLIDERAIGAMEAAVGQAVESGARLITGGRRLDTPALRHGWFYPPTILRDVDPGMSVSCTEVFGPVIGFERVKGIDDAIDRANGTEYGLTASICTSDLASAHRFAREVQAGIVRVNRPTVGTVINAPFGGIKSSGSGMHKEQLGPTVMDFYTQARTLFIGT